MYIVVRKYRSPELIDALAQREAEVRELIESVPSYKAYYFAQTADGGLTVTVCEDRAGTAESSRRAAEWIREQLPGLSATAPEITEGDVMFSFSSAAT